MKNAFETLGIDPGLVIGDEALRSAFREAGKTAHPDAGGGEAEFAALREAFEVLSSPARRLKHWLEMRGMALEARGTVAAGLMDLFGDVGAATQRAEEVVRRRGAAKSALGLAMLEAETQECRESVERALRRVGEAIESECAAFPGYEREADADAASKTVRNLTFLEKWQAGLRGVFARLV